MDTNFGTATIYFDGKRSFYSPDGAGRVWAELEGREGVEELMEETDITRVLNVSPERMDELADL